MVNDDRLLDTVGIGIARSLSLVLSAVGCGDDVSGCATSLHENADLDIGRGRRCNAQGEEGK